MYQRRRFRVAVAFMYAFRRFSGTLEPMGALFILAFEFTPN
jgi:hypothetical protein